METCTIEISKEVLQMLVDSEALTTKDFKVKYVDQKDWDFSSDVIHRKLKIESEKAYKKLKEYEFNKIHNIKSK